MKIESLQYYDGFDCLICEPCPCTLFDFDYKSINDVVLMVSGTLSVMRARTCFIWLDNQRYIFLSGNTYDVHYHGFIDKLKDIMSQK